MSAPHPVEGVPLRQVTWAKTYRIIRSIHPPIDLFEDIADPADWDALASAEAKLNPRLRTAHGDLAKVPVSRRVSGPGASFVMAPFVHASPRRPTRFSRGHYGLYYAAESEAVSVAETAYHHARTMAATHEPPGWTSDFRVLVGSVSRAFHDVNDVPGVRDPADYSIAQDLGQRLREAGSDGVVYRSVRDPSGECIGAFWPDVVTRPVQGRHYRYHWDGERVDFVRPLEEGAPVFRLTLAQG